MSSVVFNGMVAGSGMSSLVFNGMVAGSGFLRFRGSQRRDLLSQGFNSEGFHLKHCQIPNTKLNAALFLM